MKLAISRKNLWEAAPPVVKRTVGAVLGCVPQQVVLGRRFRAALQRIEETQRWSVERIREAQLAEVRRIVELAYTRTAFYKRLYDTAGFKPGDLKSLDDLVRLPTIDKQTLREHLSEMCAVPPDSANVDTVSTGGSGGEPLKFHIDRGRSAIEYAYLVAGWRRAGYDLHIPQAVLRGQIVAPDRTGLRHSYDPVLRRHYYSNFHMTDENMGLYLEHIAGIGPCFLHVYPSSATALARYIERTGRKAPMNILGVLAGSEQVYPKQRDLSKRVFGAFHSWYGHSEKLVLAAECEQCTDYHVWPLYGYCELIDKDGRSVKTPGQVGEIVGTGFINTVVPFIRYRTDDFATYVADRCNSCGREHMLIRDVCGHRTQEMLIASDGAAISWTAMNMHDDTFDRVRQFQFYQDRPGEAVLRLVPATTFGDEDRARIERNLGRKFDGRLRFVIEMVSEIRVTHAGKAIYVDQRIKE